MERSRGRAVGPPVGHPRACSPRRPLHLAPSRLLLRAAARSFCVCRASESRTPSSTRGPAGAGGTTRLGHSHSSRPIAPVTQQSHRRGQPNVSSTYVSNLVVTRRRAPPISAPRPEGRLGCVWICVPRRHPRLETAPQSTYLSDPVVSPEGEGRLPPHPARMEQACASALTGLTDWPTTYLTWFCPADDLPSAIARQCFAPPTSPPPRLC